LQANPDDPNRRLTSKELEQQPDPKTSGSYTNFREVVGRFELKPGHYIVIPATYDPNEEARFMIRVYAGKPVDLAELN
jgi:hypothetical protein